MTIVEQVQPIAALGTECQKYRYDTITLTWEDRRRGHGRRKTDLGVEFAISLPSGTILKNGDGLILTAEEVVVAVREAREPVYVVRPETTKDWAFYAYQVGNRHQSIMIAERELILLQNPATRSLLDQLGVPYSADARAFTSALTPIGHLQ